MLKILIVLCSLLCFISSTLLAKPISRQNLKIVNVHPMAVDRTHCAKCSGITRVYVNKGAGGNSNCRVDAGDLYKEDDHMLSILLMAWATGKKIRIEVNDEVKPIDQVCKITALFVTP